MKGRKIEKTLAEIKSSSVSFRLSPRDHELLREMSVSMEVSQVVLIEQGLHCMDALRPYRGLISDMAYKLKKSREQLLVEGLRHVAKAYGFRVRSHKG